MKTEQKKEYSAPKLTTHGQVETLTQHKKDGSGPGDFFPFPIKL